MLQEMSGLSPQRNRKPQGSMQNLPPREMSPSPTFRDRQRAAKTQPIPLTSSVMQMYQNQNQTRQSQQPSPPLSNGSHQSRRSPPPSAQMSSTSLISPERLTPPPAPIHTHSQNNIHQGMSPSTQPQHSHSLPNIHPHNPQIGYPRPINRVPPPQFLTSFRPMDENWAMTEELMAQIERPDPQHVVAGTAGVAYAGGAGSSGVSFVRVPPGSPPKDQGQDRSRGEKTSPKDVDNSQVNGASAGRRQGRTDRDRELALAKESPNIRERDRQPQPQPTSPAASFAQSHVQPHTPERRPSPSYHTPLGSPGENTASYTQYKRDSYPRNPTPPLMRRTSNTQVSDVSAATRATPPASVKLSSHSPPLQAFKTRSPDRSLPVQEEPEEDMTPRERDKWQGGDHLHDERDAHEDDLARLDSPTPSSDLHPEGHTSRFDSHDEMDSHREDDDETLIEQGSGDRRSHDNSEEESFTPRSPSTTLPDETQDRSYAQNPVKRQPIRVKSRGGVTDQLGLRGFETAVYEQVVNSPKTATLGSTSARTIGNDNGRRHSQQSPQQFHPPSQYNWSEQGYSQYQPPPILPDDLQSFFDDPTSSYLRAFLQSPRPNAPIPPTPHTQTAAPSPSPLISAMQSMPPYSPVPPAGSPYPFPYSHVLRPHAYPSPANRGASSSNYDPNHPSAIQEQIAMQLQMYALNNNRAAMSDSTLSPSSTPFQGAGYNPWAFLHTNRFGTRNADPLSMQSSPSHEPIPLPLPPTTNRAIRKRQRSSDLRNQVTADQLHPRVESTLPRDTSPEPSSSGEETAGEDRFDGNWMNGIVHDDSADWIDDDAAGDEDDLLELEYHPSYVSNVEKRRRRWETRWEALTEAFEALDRQTDATLVLFASPSHSTKLHALTSRSLRRDATLARSPIMSHMRSAFSQIASRRRVARSRRSSLADRLILSPGNSVDGSEHSEEELKRALGAALNSLGILGGIYEQREARWREEMRRVSEEREHVQVLLNQTLGAGLTNNNGNDTTGRAL